MPPVFSVVLCTYNAQAYLDACIQSLLHQTFADFELIIVDDGSTDSTLQYLKAIQDARVRLVVLGTNHGLIYARTRGFAEARGRYVAIMDADDIAHPRRLEEQYKVFEAGGVDVCGSWHTTLQNETGKLRKRKSFTTDSDIKALLTIYCPICNPSVSLTAELLRKTSYNVSYPHAEDYGMWCDVAATGGRLVNIPKSLLTYRLHAGQISKVKADIANQSFRKIQARYIDALMDGEVAPASMPFTVRVGKGLHFMKLLNRRIPGISFLANYQIYAEFQYRRNGWLTLSTRLERVVVALFSTLLGKLPKP
jgi:glycosyltransferase involved in cell wall biosynthesis